MVIIADNIQLFKGEVKAEALKRLRKAADVVASAARDNVPVDTGDLKASIHVEIDEGDLVARIIADALRKTPSASGPLSYAWYVETGMGNGPAQPYMRPALLSSMSEIEGIFS